MKIKRYSKLVAFRASPEEKERLSQLAFRLKLSEGKIIRKALDEYLAEHISQTQGEGDAA